METQTKLTAKIAFWSIAVILIPIFVIGVAAIESAVQSSFVIPKARQQLLKKFSVEESIAENNGELTFDLINIGYAIRPECSGALQGCFDWKDYAEGTRILGVAPPESKFTGTVELLRECGDKNCERSDRLNGYIISARSEDVAHLAEMSSSSENCQSENVFIYAAVFCFTEFKNGEKVELRVFSLELGHPYTQRPFMSEWKRPVYVLSIYYPSGKITEKSDAELRNYGITVTVY